MASRRCLLNLSRHFSSFPHHHLRTISSSSPNPQTLCPKTHLPKSISTHHFNLSRHFSTSHNSSDEEDDDDDEEDAEFDSEEEEENDELKSAEEIAQEAADIGYKVVGPVGDYESPFKPYEPVFAIVQIGAHQFKVSNGDTISTEKLKYCDVNDMLILNKVLMLGSRTQTIIGRPILPNASVHVVVEEHALDAKVIIFKKKRRKNYRRKNGHRQELTRLRIIDIQGIEKPETPEPKKKAEPKKVKSPSKKPEKVAVAA